MTVAQRIPEYRERISKSRLDGRHVEAMSDQELLKRFSIVGFTDAATYVSIDARALSEIDRKLYYLETTSGTTAAPKSRYATFQDDLIDQRLTARSFAAFGVTPDHRVLTVDLGELNFYALMTKGMAELGLYDSLFYSARKPFDRSMKEALAFKPDVLLTVPSILIRSWAAFIESLKAAPTLKKLIYYAEPLDSKIQQYLRREFGIESFSLYSSIELGIIGAECMAHDGIHVWADVLLPALKDAVTIKDKAFHYGERPSIQGLLGMTALVHEGKPTLAYLTGDMVEYTEEPCPCGRTLPRLHFIERDSETFSIYGAKFTYRQIHERVYKYEDVTNFLQIVLQDDASGTLMRLILPKESLYSIQSRQAEISYDLRSHAGLSFMADHAVLHFDFKFVPAEFFTKRKIRLIEDLRGKS